MLRHLRCGTVKDHGIYRKATLHFIICRSRRYREKHKAQKLTVKTSRQRDGMRLKWRISKRLWRSNQSAQKQRRERERNSRMRAMIRRAQRQRKATEEKRKFQMKCQTFFKSWGEKDLEQQLDSANNLLRQALALENFHKDMRQRKKIVKRLLPYFKSNRAASQCLGVRLASVHGIQTMNTCTENNKPGPRPNENCASAIRSFLKSPGVSVAQGGSRGVDKRGEPVYYLQQSLKETHRLFLENNPQDQISYSSFTKLRPSSVKLFGSTPKNMAACERCANVDLLLQTLKQNIPEVTEKLQLQSKFDALNATLCAKQDEEYHKTECLQRNCGKCGCKQFGKDILSRVGDEAGKIEWNVWCSVQSQGSTKMTLQKKEGTVKDVIESLVRALEPFGEHLFFAKWQHEAFKHAITNIHENEVVQVLDFAQNYLCLYQDEAQGAHWAHNQATVHPIVSYYKCLCGDSVREESIVISDDLKHDASAVDLFETRVDAHLKTNRGLTLERKVQFTDGAASQYKGKTAFSYLAKKSTKVIRNFFGSRHGKSPCDQAGGTIKSAVRRAVNARKAIVRNAREMFEYCNDHLTVLAERGSGCSGRHLRRSFFYVESSSIKRGKLESLRTVPGTRKLHCVSNILETPDQIMVRNLTCMCQACISDKGSCKNKNRVVDFSTVTIRRKEDSSTSAGKRERKACIEEIPKRKHEPSNVDTQKSKKHKTHGEETSVLKVNQTFGQAKVLDEECDSEIDDIVQDPDWCASTMKKKVVTRKVKKVGMDPNSHQSLDNHDWHESQNEHRPTTGASMEKANKANQEKKSKTRRQEQEQDKLCMHQATATEANNMKKDSNKQTNEEEKTESRRLYFSSLGDEMAAQKSYRELFNLMKEQYEKILSFALPYGKHRTVLDVIHTKNQVDEYSCSLIPFDVPGNSTLIACTVYGDGNCLYRSGSILCSGHEEDFRELRIRVIAELCLHEELYLDSDFLSNGHDNRNDYAEKYSQYVQNYMAEKVKGNPAIVKRLFEDQVFVARMNGVWGTMWELHALASVLKTNIYSVYPMYGYNVRSDLHRWVKAREPVARTAFIMWTNSKGVTNPRAWSPDHFVVLVEMDATE